MTGPFLLVSAVGVATLIMAAVFVSQPVSALKSNGEACKNNHKNSACVHIRSGIFAE